MPALTTAALDTLLVPRPRDSNRNLLDSNRPASEPDHQDLDDRKNRVIRPPNHVFIKPALYSTPEPTPIPEGVGDSPSPSPYVVNHKRRGGLASSSAGQRTDGSELVMGGGKVGDASFRASDKVAKEDLSAMTGDGNLPSEMEEDGFVDSRCESMSVGSSSGLNDLELQFDSLSVVSGQGEFYDADEEFSSVGSISSTPSFGHNIEAELEHLRLRLDEEIGKQETVKNALHKMYSQWQILCDALSTEGLTFPAPPIGSNNLQIENTSIEKLAQEILISRFIAEAIGEVVARAEGELAAMEILELKDREIFQLQKRLQYQKAVHHEMSQRELELNEKKRQRKMRRRKWLRVGVGFAVAMGSSLVAYSCLPHRTDNHESLFYHGSSDGSSNSS